MAHYDETKNRFNPENRFIGDIEDGKRYPFGVYTKEESDAKYAVKSTETDLTALAATVATKASSADLTALEGRTEALESAVTTKADASDLTALAQTVDTKASAADVQALSETVGTKADETEAVAIRSRLDALEREAIKITSYSITPDVIEIGSSRTVTLNWSLSKAATSQQINGTAVTGTEKQFTNVITDTEYTLTVSDGNSEDSRTVAVSTANQVYFGAAAKISQVTELANELTNEKTRTVTVEAGAGEYIYYAVPARLGTVALYADGIKGGFEEPIEKPLTNASGYQELYYVYQSVNTNLGETTVEAKEA